MAQSALLIPQDIGTPCLVEQPLDFDSVVRHLSHELRQPLSTIETSTYYLKMILSGGDPRACQQLEKIDLMIHQMNWILSDAIHFLQAAHPHPQWIDLSEIIADQLSSQAVQQRIELDWTESSSTPLVRIDPSQAEHMIRTILSVFRQIARSDVALYVSLYRDCDNAVLEASSDASPHLLENCEDLFTPFTPHLPAGSGLAMASVKRIAEVHGGRVNISAGSGRLRLEVTLPAC